MKLKVEYIILGVIILAIVLFLVLRTGNRVQYDLPEIVEVDRDAIVRIAVEGPELSFELERAGVEWVIVPQGYPADSSQIDEMAASIAGLSLTAMVSESQRYSRYDLDEGSRIRVTAVGAEGVELSTFLVGKQGSSRRSSFVLVPGDERVFTSSSNLRDVFEKEVAKLRDLVVMSFDASEISEISARREGEILVLSKAEEESDGESVVEWKTPDGRVWDAAVVDRVIKSLSNLRCSEYLEEGSALDAETMSVTLKGNKGYSVSFHGERDSRHAALSSENDYPFLLSSYQFGDVEKIFEAPQVDEGEG